MAADTRPYKSKEQDGQGNELIIRDQQLVEQDTTTTMPAGTCFQTLDVDGRPVKIPKGNMVDIVREALGTLLNGLSDQTTVAKFLTLNGNTLGASAAATAASVLGAFTIITSSFSMDEFTKNGNFRIGDDELTITNTPFPSQQFSFINYYDGDRALQIAFRNNVVKYRIRWGAWNTWVTIQVE